VYGPIDEPILRRRAPSPVKKCFTYLHFLGFSTKILACVHKSDRLLAPDEVGHVRRQHQRQLDETRYRA
jgi:hypothetical protein